MLCLDAHVHCGINKMFTPQGFEDYYRVVAETPINGAVLFPFISDIYDRQNPYFTDTPDWQKRRKWANKYILSLVKENFEIFPFLFIWNDFATQDLTEKHRGIKWHRHANEPVYRYEDPRCFKAIEDINNRNMPVVFEEVLSNTLGFVRELAPDVTVIIPHMGFLNGGYQAIVDHGLFEQPNVYADTSLASTGEIVDYIHRYGHERILFGSDFPFGDPLTELEKILRLPIPTEKQEAIAGLNLERLLSESNV